MEHRTNDVWCNASDRRLLAHQKTTRVWTTVVPQQGYETDKRDGRCSLPPEELLAIVEDAYQDERCA